MTSLWEMPAVVVALLAWLAAPPTSMADAARRESVRRLLTAKSAVVYTNDTLPAARPSDLSPEPVSSQSVVLNDDGEVVQKVISEVASAAPAAVEASGGGDEKSWRDRLAALTSALASDEVLAAGLQSRASSLQADFIARDDPAQRRVIGDDLGKTLAELDRMRAKIQADQSAITKLREDGRRQGIPPGWLR